ncbi:putative bifunctional diguanylate cyclase/phosphodiesterase [Peribacillus deserti]|nr:bifunctional diguanylate cyclase/phosphodiesterase [Peribacillus deserti]
MNSSMEFYLITIGALLFIIVVKLYLRLLIKRKLGISSYKFTRKNDSIFYLVIICLFIGGKWYEHYLGEEVHTKYKRDSEYIGTLFSKELRQLNHQLIDDQTASGMAVYHRIYNKMLDWQNSNPQVISIYTLKKNEQKDNYFAVGLETDYNRDGIIRGDDELKIPIGTLYDEYIPELERAFTGKYSIQEYPTKDEWGYSLSAFYPINSSADSTDAVLGIDYDGDSFVKAMEQNQWRVFGFLIPAIIAVLLIFVVRMYTKIERQAEYLRRKEIDKMAYYDDLTNLPNRNFILDVIDSYSKEHPAFAVMLFDLRGLDSINNLLGYTVGDNFLKKAISKIHAELSQGQLLGRWGGCDFVLIVPDYHSEKQVLAIAEDILNKLKNPILMDGREFQLSAQFGISTYPKDGTDGKTLINNADMARTHLSKYDNRHIQFFNEQVVNEVHKKLNLEIELRKALQRNEFVLFYQPQLSVKTGEMIGMEALIRWIHPEKGMVPPNDFIPLAEELKLIESIGRWVIKEACEQTMLLFERTRLPLTVSVNLSPIQFENESIVSDIQSILEETGLPARYLDLEITESAIVNYQRSSTLLKGIKSLGVQISLDDFGAGYSSLSHLKNLTIDRLKIDRSFLKDIPEKDDTILSSIILLGHHLQLIVLAEGAETKDHLEFLKKRDCDQVQGYYLSKPIPFAEIEEYVKNYQSQHISRTS